MIELNPTFSEAEKTIGKCENCKRENVLVRRITIDDNFKSTDRGYADLCGNCFSGRSK